MQQLILAIRASVGWLFFFCQGENPRLSGSKSNCNFIKALTWMYITYLLHSELPCLDCKCENVEFLSLLPLEKCPRSIQSSSLFSHVQFLKRISLIQIPLLCRFASYNWNSWGMAAWWGWYMWCLLSHWWVSPKPCLVIFMWILWKPNLAWINWFQIWQSTFSCCQQTRIKTLLDILPKEGRLWQWDYYAKCRRIKLIASTFFHFLVLIKTHLSALCKVEEARKKKRAEVHPSHRGPVSAYNRES